MEASGRWIEICPGVAEREARRKSDGIAATGRRMEDEVFATLAGDAPAAVMELHVVPAAEQDAAIDVGASALGVGIDVMRLAVRSGPIATAPAATTVTGGERDALLR